MEDEQKRLLLAIGMMMLVMLGFQYFNAPGPQQRQRLIEEAAKVREQESAAKQSDDGIETDSEGRTTVPKVDDSAAFDSFGELPSLLAAAPLISCSALCEASST